MTCLMNYLPEERGELQSAAMEARAREQRNQISALHDRWVGWGLQAQRQPSPLPPAAGPQPRSSVLLPAALYLPFVC